MNIGNLIEQEADGWAVWIKSEDQIQAGQQALAAYERNPGDRKYQNALQDAEAQERRNRQEQAKAAKRTFGRDRILARSGLAPLTLLLIGISVVVTLAIGMNPSFRDIRWLVISEGPGLEEVRGRPGVAIDHAHLYSFWTLHLIFNMLWLFDLGGMIESRQGTLKLGLMALVLGVASNLGQYFLAGPFSAGCRACCTGYSVTSGCAATVIPLRAWRCRPRRCG